MFIYVLFLVVLGVLLFIYCSDISLEGFQSGSSGSSGSYMSSRQAYVIDCTIGPPGAECVALTKDTDRLTYLQRLPIGGRLLSANKNYTLMYRPDGVLVFYDLVNMKILWTSDTRGSSGSSVYPAYIWNSGVIDARTGYGAQLPWQPKQLSTSGSSGSSQSVRTGDSVITQFTAGDVTNTDFTIQTNNTYAQYVRIKPSQSKGDGTLNLSQIIVKDSGGVNISSTATPSATSSYRDSATRRTVQPSKMIDGTTTVQDWGPGIWQLANADRDEYIQLDFGRRVQISSVRILGRRDCCCGTSSVKDRCSQIRIYLEDPAPPLPPIYSIPSDKPDNTMYLKVTNYGDLAIFNGANSLLWTAGIATPPPPSNECVPEKMDYPFTTDDCYDLNNNITANENLITQLSLPFDNSSSSTRGSIDSSVVPPSRTSEMNAAKAILCNLKPYYTNLKCATHLATTGSAATSKWGRNLSSDTGGSAIPQPKVAYTGSIQNLSNTATMTGDVTQWVKVDDLIYFGYLLDVQGPFVVKAISAPGVNTTLTFTKKYIGANLSGAIVSVVSSTPVATTMSTTVGSLPNPSANKTIVLEDSPLEVYAFGNGTTYTLATAATACATFGGTVATYEQLVDAHAKGAHWQWYGVVDDSGRARFAFPLQIANSTLNYKAGINELTTMTSAGLVCYGRKPPAGTTYRPTSGSSGSSSGNPILNFSAPYGNFDTAVPTMYNGANMIVGSVMGGTSFINTKNALLPPNVNIGDLIYIEGICNEYDIDNGDGTCTAYDCMVGEKDLLQNNQCMKYKCNPPSTEGIQENHTLTNGICTAPTEYTPCPKSIGRRGVGAAARDSSLPFGQNGTPLKRVTSNGQGINYGQDYMTLDGTNGNVCNYTATLIDSTMPEFLAGRALDAAPIAYGQGQGWNTINSDVTPYLDSTLGVDLPWNPGGGDNYEKAVLYSIRMTPKKASYTYSVTKQGLPDILTTKTTSNPSYKYPKTLGPFVVASQPSITSIMIKSYTPGDLNSNGDIMDISSGSPPSTNIRNKVPALFGLQNAKLYKVPYESVTTMSGSSGSMVSVSKKVLACSLGAYGNSCSFCAAGQTTLAIGSRTCTACVKNSTSVPGVTANSPLVPGGGGTCTWCTAGKSTRGQNGAPSCSNCDAGYSSNGNGGDCVGCALGFNSNAGELCKPCRVGQTTTAVGTAICTNCSAGWSSTGTGGSCFQCGAGQIAAAGDPLGCHTCGAGTAAGSDINTVAAGNPAYAQSCSPCKAGYSSTGTGTGGCYSCGTTGRYSTQGDTSCSYCGVGKQANASYSGCDDCAAGKSSNGQGGVCTNCNAGQTSVRGGACTNCPAGTYAATAGSTICTPCARNSSSNEGASVCTPCYTAIYSNTQYAQCALNMWRSYTIAGMESVANSVTTSATIHAMDPLGVNIQYARSTAMDKNGNLYITSSTCILIVQPPAPNKIAYNTVDGWTVPGLITPAIIEQYNGSRISIFAGTITGGVEITTNFARMVSFYNIAGLCYDPNLNCLYVSDPIIHSITKVTCDGGSQYVTSTVLIGNSVGQNGNVDGAQTTARIKNPKGLCVDSNSTIYFADWGNNSIRKLVGGTSGSGGTVSTVATINSPIDVCVTSDNNILYVTSASDNCIYKLTISGSSYTKSTYYTGLKSPAGLCRDAQNNLFVYDTGNNRILLITGGASPSAMELRSGIPPFTTSALADQAFFAGLTYDGMGNVYHIEGGNNTIGILSSMPE